METKGLENQRGRKKVMFAHVVISGFVQGVGYRQFVKKTALKLNLNGWVKNIDQRRVETGLIGPKEKIEEALKAFKKGSFLSQVKNVQAEWEEKEPDFNGFEIIV